MKYHIHQNGKVKKFYVEYIKRKLKAQNYNGAQTKERLTEKCRLITHGDVSCIVYLCFASSDLVSIFFIMPPP